MGKLSVEEIRELAEKIAIEKVAPHERRRGRG